MKEIIDILQSASPIGAVVLSLVVILYLVRNEKKMDGYKEIATNHTSGVPEMHETLKRIEQNQLQSMRDTNDLNNEMNSKLVEILTIVKKRR